MPGYDRTRLDSICGKLEIAHEEFMKTRETSQKEQALSGAPA